MKPLNYLTGVVSISVAIGIVQKYFYYRAFGIRIFDYLSLGETLLLMEELIPLMILAILFTWIVALIVNIPASKLGKKNEQDKTENEEGKTETFEPYLSKSKFFPRLWENISKNFKGVLILIVMAPFYFIKSKNPEVEFIRHWLLLFPILLILVMMVQLEFLDRITRIAGKRIPIGIEMVLHYGTILIPMLIMYNFAKIDLVKGKQGIEKVFIKMDNEIYPTTNSTYYIGKTSDFIFFYDSKNKSTEVIPMNRVSSLSYK